MRSTLKKGTLTGRIVTGVDALCRGVGLLSSLRLRDTAGLYIAGVMGMRFMILSDIAYSEEYLNSEVRRYMEECLFENEHITGVYIR